MENIYKNNYYLDIFRKVSPKAIILAKLRIRSFTIFRMKMLPIVP